MKRTRHLSHRSSHFAKFPAFFFLNDLRNAIATRRLVTRNVFPRALALHPPRDTLVDRGTHAQTWHHGPHSSGSAQARCARRPAQHQGARVWGPKGTQAL